MSKENNSLVSDASQQSRLLHTMLRISNLERSLAFYVDGLGMRQLRRENYPDGRFTLVFIGYGDEASGAVIELTHNWDEQQYQQGTAFGHVAIGVHDIYSTCERLALMGVKIARQPGPMTYVSDTGLVDVIAFLQDPDGYRIELIEIR